MASGRISSPDWSKVIGGTEEASWLSDRNRKLGLIFELSPSIINTAYELESKGALFTPSPEILTAIPFAADWYVSLAGYALKTLNNISYGPAAYGLSLKADTVRKNLTEGRRVSPREVAAFSAWLASEIEGNWMPVQRTLERALVVVSAILGGRVIGQGQNTGGSDAVILLKSALADYADTEGVRLHLWDNDHWIRNSEDTSIALSPKLKLGNGLRIEFPVGGNVPDVRFENFSSGKILGVGEVKGRKDLSNVWESWMPQVADHMRTWTGEIPGALRLFFGTVITSQMVNGASIRGTSRIGLRWLHENDYLQGVYNLSHLVMEESEAWNSFSELMEYFLSQV